CLSAARRSRPTKDRSSRAVATCSAISWRAPESAWRRLDAEETRELLQAALGRLRRGHENPRGRDVERAGLPVCRRLSRGVPPLHGGAEPDQLLRRQDRRGIHAQARKIAGYGSGTTQPNRLEPHRPAVAVGGAAEVSLTSKRRPSASKR